MAVYCKGKPYTPPIVGGITFTLFDEARGIWSGSGTAPQEAALTGPGTVFMSQSEFDAFTADAAALLLPVPSVPATRNGKANPFVALPGASAGAPSLSSILSSVMGRAIKIWLVGDSRVQGNSRACWRRILWQMLRQVGYDVEFLGHTPLDANSFDGYAFTLGDWRHSGVAGDRWEDFTAACAARAAVAGEPDVILVDLGINNAGAHQPLATIKARALEGVSALRAAWPSAQILLTTISPYFSDATAQALIVPYNAWLLAQSWPNVTVLDIGARILVDDKIDGLHENPQGSAKYARGWFDGIRDLYPVPNGLSMPRPLAPRLAQASLNVPSGAADYYRATNVQAACGVEAAKSYLASFWHAPTNVDATNRYIAGFGASYADGWALMHQNGQVLPYGSTGILGTAGGVLPFLTAGKWHRFVFGLFKQTSASDPRPCVGVWVDGRLVAVTHIPAWPDSTAGGWLQIGYSPSTGIAGSVGPTDDFSVHKWAGAPFLDAARDLVERDFYDGLPFPNRTAHWVCGEGTGTTAADRFGGTSLTRGGAAGWIAAGALVKPCDG